jgi:thiol-disulfide isomerase/thioredoxin
VWTGLVVLAVALLAAAGVAGYRHRVDGRFAAQQPADPERAAAVFSEGDLSGPLGRQATVVQFSSSFCAPCRAAERIIGRTVAGMDGVRYVDVDAERAIDLVRRFKVLRTPTILVTDRHGRVLSRTAGVPTAQALQDALADAGSR